MSLIAESSPVKTGRPGKIFHSRRGALLLAALLLALWGIQHFLQNKGKALESRKQEVLREHNRISREESLRLNYSPEFDLMLSAEHNAATTRLALETSIRDIVAQNDAQLERLVLDAQRQRARQHSPQGFHLNETAVEVDVSTVSESSAYQIVSGLTQLPTYANAIESCTIDLPVDINTMQASLNEGAQRPVRLTCYFNLYEIKRN